MEDGSVGLRKVREHQVTLEPAGLLNRRLKDRSIAFV
jgi:N-acetylmuramoyl-L-alanine amidase